MNITALAAEDLNNLNLDIGGVIVDVEQVTEENSVNPYALKVAIEEGLNAEKASSFSSLATWIPNTQASDSVEYSLTKSAMSTKVNKTDQD